MTDRFDYGVYGESLVHSGSSDTPFQFNSQYGVQTDPNGLLYMRARYYNPKVSTVLESGRAHGSNQSGD
jgi:RHS repeat-associated protein